MPGLEKYTPTTYSGRSGAIFEHVFDIRSYGAAVDGSTDDTTAIINAMTACAAVGGGTVYLPAGDIKITSTLDVPNKVKLVGAGRGSFNVNIATFGATKLYWYGASGGTMIQCATLATETDKRTGQAVVDLTLHGRGIAATGLLMVSLHDCEVKIFVRDTTAYMIDMQCLAGAGRDTQMCSISLLGRSSTGSGIRMDGSPGDMSNTSMNQIPYVDVILVTGTGLELRDCDSNFFKYVRVVNASSADTIQMHGNNDGANPNGVCRGNHFEFVTGTGAIRSYGTETYVNPARRNYIEGIDRGNSTPLPTLGTGAQLFYRSAQYNERYQAAYAGAVTMYADGTLASSVTFRCGTGSPEGVVTANVGSLYLRLDGGATTTLYVKTSGTGNTGWTAK